MSIILETVDQLAGFLFACIIAFGARAMALSIQRPALTFALLWELPVIFSMGVIGSGLAEWLGYRAHVQAAVIACVAYLGPNTIASLFRLVVRKADP